MANTSVQLKRKYHIIYQTTNIINNKIYIGAHSTDNVNDDYLGSGADLARAVVKYGRSNFRKNVLYIFETPEEMFLKEKEIVNVDFLKRPDVYNIVEGGYGGYNKGTTGLKHMHHSISGDRCAVHPSAINRMIQEGWALGRNMSSTTGTVWIHNEQLKKMIPADELLEYIKNGWKKGLPESFTAGKTWIFHSDTNRYSLCNAHELNAMLSDGWIKKKWAPVKKGAHWINNGVENKRVFDDELQEYISDGWSAGMIPFSASRQDI